MSSREVRDDVFASPERARSLLTVRAAISLARFVEAPCSFSLSTMCSYWRSRLLLQAFWGMGVPSSDGCPREMPRRPSIKRPLVLDVVLGGVLVGQLVDDVEAL